MMQLWTPTDWAEETRLRIDYLAWQIEHNELPCLRLTFLKIGFLSNSQEELFRMFTATGVLFYNSEDEIERPSYEPLTFEEWRALHENSRFYGL